MNISHIQELSDGIRQETEKIIFGKSEQIRLIVLAVLSGGHVLLEDLPGVGKTTLVKTISLALGCDSRRIQFVPDLLPADILGTNIYNQKTGDFELRQGPVMTNLLLADEINRAIPRTQSALLEAMEEHQVTIDGVRFALPEPFLVLATQNPVDAENTFKLPAAQMDRFLLRIHMGYPSPQEERKMLRRLGDEIPFSSIRAVTNAEEIMEARQEVNEVYVSDAVADYIIAICDATRSHGQLRMGASPRASRNLYRAAKAWAAMNGRGHVTPDDVKTLAHPVLEHRLLLKTGAHLSAGGAAAVLDEILEATDAAPSLEASAHEE